MGPVNPDPKFSAGPKLQQKAEKKVAGMAVWNDLTTPVVRELTIGK